MIVEKEGMLQGENSSCRFRFFDSSGGVSAGLYSSLNIGYSVGDDPERVAENRGLVKAIMGIGVLVNAWQVHGSELYCLDGMPTADLRVEHYDGLLTSCRGVGLMIQHADCQAVLLYDPVHGAIAALHSGWRSSVANIIGKAVAAMGARFGSDPAQLKAMIGPSLGPCCGEFVNFRQELPEEFWAFGDSYNHFDFWEISKAQLRSAGLVSGNIGVLGICTSCSPDYFSYRRSVREHSGVGGRNCSVIVLQ